MYVNRLGGVHRTGAQKNAPDTLVKDESLLASWYHLASPAPHSGGPYRVLTYPRAVTGAPVVT